MCTHVAVCTGVAAESGSWAILSLNSMCAVLVFQFIPAGAFSDMIVAFEANPESTFDGSLWARLY
jgi:hypothetical protein